MFKISPDETLRIVQELYEKKLVTYPRTDARVLSTAAAKEISRNLNGLSKYQMATPYLQDILQFGSHKNLAKTRYVNDKQITDHYAIIPTGQGLGVLSRVAPLGGKVYELIVRRFLSIFYPAAVYQRYSLELEADREHFFAGFRVLKEQGYLKVADVSRFKKKTSDAGKNLPEARESGRNGKDGSDKDEGEKGDSELNRKNQENPAFIAMLDTLRKGAKLPVAGLSVKEGETSPPKRYSSGSMILAMETPAS